MDKTLHILGNERTLMDPTISSSIPSPNSAFDLLGIGDLMKVEPDKDSSVSPVVSDGEPIGTESYESIEVADDTNKGRRTLPQCLESAAAMNCGSNNHDNHDIVKDRYRQWAAMLGETNGVRLIGSTVHSIRDPDARQPILESLGHTDHDEDLVQSEIHTQQQQLQPGDKPTDGAAESLKACHQMNSGHGKVLDEGDVRSPSRRLQPLHTAVMDHDADARSKQDLVQDADSPGMEHRLAAVLDGAVQRGFLELSFKMGGRRMSTGSLYAGRAEYDYHKSLNPTVSALLEPLLAIDEGSMEWRNLILQDYEERQKELDSVITLNHIEYFVHPLHDAEDPQVQRRRLFPCSDDDVSVMTTDSASSKWSLAATYSSLFGTRSASKRFSGLKTKRSGRRFIDLTINNISYDDMDDDDMIECDDEDGDDDSLGRSDTATLYSIPVQKCRTKETGEERSEARQFLDLTHEIDNDPQHLEGAGQSKRTGFAWMGRQGSMSSLFGSHADVLNTKVPKCDKYSFDVFDDAASSNSEEDDPRVLTPWEAADAAFMENVHEIASNLERKLNERGFESPYWSTESIIPPFEGLHEKIKNMIERKKKESDAPPTVVAKAPELKLDRPVNGIGGSKVSRVTLRLSSKFNDIGGRRSLPIQQDSTGGYDDLGMRTLHRDDDAYLKNFLYCYRPDGFCMLPVVLATGLEKCLDHDTVHVALDILEDLTSPLRQRQRTSLPMVSEESDGLLADGSDASYNASNTMVQDESIGDLPTFLLAERERNKSNEW